MDRRDCKTSRRSEKAFLKIDLCITLLQGPRVLKVLN